jgi:RNA polymerase-binding protein DksA
MATSRKAGASRSKPKPTRKPAKPAAKPAASAGARRGAKPAASAARAGAAKPVSKPVAKPVSKPAPAKGRPHPGAVPVRVVGKPAVASARPGKAVAAPPTKGKLKGKAAPKPPAPVQPLGVLPPSAIARATHRPRAPIAPERPPARPAPRVTTPTGGPGVTEKDFDEFRERLLEERQKILKEMGHLESTVLRSNQRDSAGDLSSYSFHMADQGTDAMEREKAFHFASAEGRLLLEVHEALRRIHSGEYGVCESCGGPIGRARLEAVPYARLCISCKAKEERAARGAS